MNTLTKSIINIPLIELNNYCIINELELDIEREEIIICSFELPHIKTSEV